MKFLADSMLGRLAKWLRLMGLDTAYAKGDDREIVRRARAEGRMILTRDRALIQRQGIQAFLVKSDMVQEQVSEVMDGLGLRIQEPFPRCPECNGELLPVEKLEIKDLVPPYVYSTQSQFHRCPDCCRIYWQGTHWARITERIEHLEENL